MERLNAAIAAAGAADRRIFGAVTLGDNLLGIEVQPYAHGGDAPLRLQLYAMEEGQPVEPFGTVTVCVPGERAAEDEVFVKTHFENDILRQPLLATGYFVDTGRRVPVGRGDHVEVWKITPAFVSAFAASGPFDHPCVSQLAGASAATAAPVVERGTSPAKFKAAPRVPATPKSLVELTKIAVDLFEEEFARVGAAVKADDLGHAQFPRTGNDARIELTTRLGAMQWVLEMLPSRKTLQLDAQQLRDEAIAMLKLASSLDGRSLHAITHSHGYGDDTHLAWGKGFLDEDAAAVVIGRTSSFEPHLGESLVVTAIALDQLSDSAETGGDDPVPVPRMG